MISAANDEVARAAESRMAKRVYPCIWRVPCDRWDSLSKAAISGSTRIPTLTPKEPPARAGGDASRTGGPPTEAFRSRSGYGLSNALTVGAVPLHPPCLPMSSHRSLSDLGTTTNDERGGLMEEAATTIISIGKSAPAYGPILVAAIGFTGVCATLLYNAWKDRKDRRDAAENNDREYREAMDREARERLFNLRKDKYLNVLSGLRTASTLMSSLPEKDLRNKENLMAPIVKVQETLDPLILVGSKDVYDSAKNFQSEIELMMVRFMRISAPYIRLRYDIISCDELVEKRNRDIAELERVLEVTEDRSIRDEQRKKKLEIARLIEKKAEFVEQAEVERQSLAAALVGEQSAFDLMVLELEVLMRNEMGLPTELEMVRAALSDAAKRIEVEADAANKALDKLMTSG